MSRGKTHFRCLSGGGATLETFLTLLLCCERCWQTPSTLALLNVSWACSMPLLERIRKVPSGTTLSWQCSRSTTNAISELLLFCVYVCVMRYIFISVLFSLGVRGVCVRCGYEDRIHFGRILEELWVVCTRIESIIWSIFTVKVIDYRFRFLLSLWSTWLHHPMIRSICW